MIKEELKLRRRDGPRPVLRNRWWLPMNLQKFLLLAAAAVLTAAFGQHYFGIIQKRKQVLVFKALATAMPVMLAFCMP